MKTRIEESGRMEDATAIGRFPAIKFAAVPSEQNVERLFVRSCLESAPPRKSLHQVDAWRTGPAQPARPLHLLKQRLLHAALEKASDSETCRRLCGAANTAAELAWNTDCPSLLFPCLFEEMAAAIPAPLPNGRDGSIFT